MPVLRLLRQIFLQASFNSIFVLIFETVREALAISAIETYFLRSYLNGF